MASFLRLQSFGWILLCVVLVTATNFVGHTIVWGANCDAELENDAPIEKIFGPIDPIVEQRTEKEKEGDKLQRIAEQKAKAEQEQLEQEVKLVTNQLQVALDDIDLWLRRADLYEKLDKRDAAISDLTEVMKRQGESVDGLTRRARLWLKMNQFEKAEADAKQAIKLEPRNAETFFALGEVYREQWKVDDAYKSYTLAIRIDPNHVLALYNRAYVVSGANYGKKGVELAAQDLKKVLELDPEMDKAHYRNAEVLHALRRNEEAAQEATYVLTRHPDLECMVLLRWKIYMALEKYDLAVADADRWMKFNPARKGRIELRARAYDGLDDYEKSVADWSVYLEVYPENITAHQFRTQAYASLDRYEEAVAGYTRLMELDPKSSRWLEYRARNYLNLRRFDEAMADVDRAAELQPTFPQFQHLRARIYKAMGESAKARAETIKYRKLADSRKRGSEPSPYEQHRDELEKHIEEQFAKIRAGESPSGSKFGLRLHPDHEDWGKLWLTALNELLSDPGNVTLETRLKYVRMFVEQLDLYPIPQEETEELITLLNSISESNEADALREKARTDAVLLGAFLEANDPTKDAVAPGSLVLDRVNFSTDALGQDQSFRQHNQPHQWLKYNEEHTSGALYFRELKRTPEYIELIAIQDATWVRISPHQVLQSPDGEAWFPINEFPGRLVLIEEQELTNHVQRQVAQLKQGKAVEAKALYIHYRHHAWGALWLEGLTAVLSEENQETKKQALDALVLLTKNAGQNNLPVHETRQAQYALTSVVVGEYPQAMKNDARFIAKVLGVLSRIHAPGYSDDDPNCLLGTQFSYPADEQGRSGVLRKNQGNDGSWQSMKEGRAWARLLEVRRTSKYVELFDPDRGIWTRIEPTQAFWSFDHSNWQLIGKGALTGG